MLPDSLSGSRSRPGFASEACDCRLQESEPRDLKFDNEPPMIAAPANTDKDLSSNNKHAGMQHTRNGMTTILRFTI